MSENFKTLSRAFLPFPSLLTFWNNRTVRISCQAWRPGQINTEAGKEAAAVVSASSQPAPETMQMVAPRDGSQSARSGRGADDRRRIPSMQLARLKDGGGAEGEQGTSESAWTVAIAEPMPPLHGFCLGVVGLETGMVGAAVTLVKRSVATPEEEAAVGFLGFDKVKILYFECLMGVLSIHTEGRLFFVRQRVAWPH